MSFVIGGNNPVSTGYNLTRSLRTRASASAYLNRTPATTTNQKTWTWSGWIKRGTLGQSGASSPFFFNSSSAGTDAAFFACGFNGDALSVTGYATNYLTTSAVYRDTAAWYHVVIAVDTTQATTSNRIKLYVNGSQVTAFSTANYVAQNFNTPVNLNQAHYLSAYNIGSGAQNFNDLYLTEVNFIDGLQLTPSSFGSTNALTGVWQPARYTGTYGTNGFYLPFTDNSALTTSSNVGLGKDFSGNGNYWTTNNISITAGVTYDSMTDVPTLTSATAANFAVLNPLDVTNTTKPTNGNLTYSPSATSPQVSISTIGMPSTGKWYAEITKSSATSSWVAGIIGTGRTDTYTGSTNSIGYFDSGNIYKDGVSVQSSLATLASGDVVGIAVDSGAQTVQFYKNNSAVGTAVSYTYSQVWFACGNYVSGLVFEANFGQRPFTYTPPTGFVRLNTYNLPTSTIVKGNTVMDATLYTGNGSTQTITNTAGFKSDFIWLKSRSAAQNSSLTDSVRGVNSQLFSNLTDAQGTQTDQITAFNSNGFSLGANAAGTGGTNVNTVTYVGWQWQAGQGSSSSNTNGSITSTVSVNASAGFSVVTYTGTAVAGTIGHGLGVAPQLIIVKPRSATITTDAWNVYHVSTGNTNFLVLNATDASAAASNRWNNTSPTSSVFSIGTVPSSVAVGYVAYCWTPIAGFSAFGSYTGNGSTSGPFIYTGFQPKYILIKRTDTTDNWYIKDSARNPYNSNGNTLLADSSSAEFGPSNTFVNFLSNGINLVTTSTGVNASGGTYIYAAFASNPFKNSLAF